MGERKFDFSGSLSKILVPVIFGQYYFFALDILKLQVT